MSNLTRRDPLDDFFRGFFVRPVEFGSNGNTESPQMRVDVKENAEGYEVHAELPGMKKEDIHVHIDGPVVSTSAARKQVYRALKFLQGAGLVHRIESMNAYVACGRDHAHANGQFLICDECGDVQEIQMTQMDKTIGDKAGAAGFKPDHWSAEIHGTCRDC